VPILTVDQLDEILNDLRMNSKVSGILLTGSYVYGTPKETSDVDICCVTSDGSDWAELERMQFGVPINIFYNPPDVVRKYMIKSVEEGHGDCVHFWANGKIFYDSSGIMQKLQTEARKLWKAGPGNNKQWEWRWKKHNGGYSAQDWELP